MTPVQTMDFLENDMMKYYPVGDVKLPSKEALSKLAEIEKGAK